MRAFETKDWLFLNSIIYKIYTMDNMDEMRREFLAQIHMFVDFDSADFHLAAADEDKRLVQPVFYNCDEDYAALYDELDYSRGILYSGKTLIYRETDIIPDEKRIKTDYYRKVYKPNNWHYSLQMILARKKELVGVVTFYRTIGKDDFSYDDIFVLDMLKEHLSYRLYKHKSNGNPYGEKITVSAATSKYGLTRREHTILRMLMEGKDSRRICEELVIAENTLKKHIRNLYKKLGVNSRVNLFKMIREKE